MQNIKNTRLFEKNTYLSSSILYITILIAAVIIASFFWNPVYGTSDDWILDSWFNSNYTGSFESGSIYTTALFSYLTSALYSLQFGLAWYAIVLLIMTITSLTHLLVIINHDSLNKKDYIKSVIRIIFITSIFLWCYFGLTFTSTAIFSGIVGIISLLKSVEISAFRKVNSYLGIFLILMSYIIRPESLVGALAVFAPLIIIKLGQINKKNYYFQKKFIFTSLLVILVFFINNSIENGQSSDTKEYRNWIEKVQVLADSPLQEGVREKLETAGWSVNEYHMFYDKLYFDKSVFDENWIEKGVGINEGYSSKIKVGIKQLNQLVENHLNSVLLFFPSFLSIIIGGLLLYRRVFNLGVLLKLGFILLWFLGLQIYVAIFLHSVSRVTIPLYFGICLILTINWWNLSLDLKKVSVKTKYIISGLTIIITVITLFNLNILQKNNNQNILISQDTTRLIKQDLSDYVIVVQGNQEFDQWRSPYISIKNDPIPNVIMFGNWDTFSPQWNQRLQNIGLNSNNLTSDLLNKNNILWASQDFPEATIHYLNFFSQNGYGQYKFNLKSQLPNKSNLRYLSKID